MTPKMNDRMKEFYMDVAQRAASMSRATRLQVGSVVVKDGNIISFSWNGTPPGWDNNCEEKVYFDPYYQGTWTQDEIDKTYPFTDSRGRYTLTTKAEVIHAEMNALLKLAKGKESAEGASMFCTHAPCVDCAKSIFTAGIKNVFYRDQYRDARGIDLLNKSGVKCEQINAQ